MAVKVLLSDLKTEGARRRFESEANLMAQLSSHPYIVTIFEAEVTEDGHSYLAMEYCSRPSLDVRYRRQRFSVDEVLAVGIQVASAVETAHRAGIAHRDIKPANILVTDYNRPGPDRLRHLRHPRRRHAMTTPACPSRGRRPNSSATAAWTASWWTSGLWAPRCTRSWPAARRL